MNSDELYTLKSMVLDNYEQYHDGLRIRGLTRRLDSLPVQST